MKGKYLCLQTNTKLNTADKVRNKIKTPAKSARLGVGDFSVLHWSPTPSGKVSIVRWLGEPRQRTIEILPSGVGDFPVLHFAGVRFYISHFWDRPVPIFSDVRFSYLALVQDKKITCVLPANACCTVYVNCVLRYKKSYFG